MSWVFSTNATTAHSEFSYVSPVSTEITRPSLSGSSSSLPYRRTRTMGSSVQSWDASSGDFMNEDFRVGGPLLAAIPAWTMPVRPTTPELYRLISQSRHVLQQTKTILNRFGVHNPDVDICTRTSMLFPEPAPLATILVLARRSTVDDRWLRASYQIHALLLQNNFQNVQVEIADERGLRRPTCYPVDENDKIYPIWDAVSRRIIASSNLLQWISLECFRYDREDDPSKNPTAVVLSVHPVLPADWTPTRNVIVSILDSFELWHVAVYIVPDVLFRGVDLKGQASVLETDSPEQVKASVSVGLSFPECSSGTLGGFVEIEHPDGGWKKVVITCFHVVYPHKDLGLPQKDNLSIRRWLENPIAPDDPDAARILNVSQPSAADIVAEIEDCDNKILSFQDSNFVKTKAAMLKDNESVPGPEKREYKLVQAMIKHREDIRDSLKRLLKFNIRIGTVFAGSGFLRTKRVPMWNEETIRDWALIEIAPYGDKPDEPFRPNVPIRYFYTDNPHNCGALYKAGRTTKYTAGIYSGLRSAHMAQKLDRDGRLVTFVTREHAVAGISQNFSEKGDSGSFLLNNMGCVVGLFFGRSGTKKVSCFTHSNDLISNIKETHRCSRNSWDRMYRIEYFIANCAAVVQSKLYLEVKSSG